MSDTSGYSDPQFTIMIMSHDNKAMLLECLDLLEKYTPFPYELVIVDDASTEDYSDIKCDAMVRMPRRSDCCTLRNVGMAMSKTPFVFWLDNDTFVGPGWHEPFIETMLNDKEVGLVGQPKDGRMVRNPFLPLTQSDCMIEKQFAYDYDHNTGLCDFIVSYCVLVRKEAFRPIHSFNMPTPTVDPELGLGVKAMGYKVTVGPHDANIRHLGSATARPNGREYLYTLAKNFTLWWKFWEHHAPFIMELHKPGNKVMYNHDAAEPSREGSRNVHGDFDIDRP